jgi:general secretion pathway protein B
MSYILEALKKSEQERQQNRPVDALQAPFTTPQGRAPSRHGQYPALAVALLIAGVLLGWWQPWKLSPQQEAAPAPPSPPPPVEAAPVPSQQAAPSGPPTRAEALRGVQSLVPGQGRPELPAPLGSGPQTLPVPPSSVPPTRPALPPSSPTGGAPSVAIAPTQPAPPPPPTAVPPGATTAGPTASTPPRVAANPAPPRDLSPEGAADVVPKGDSIKEAPAQAPKGRDRKAETKVAAVPDLPAPPSRVLTLADLPEALRASFPPLTVRGFVYSDDPRSRMVVINDRMLQEGDEVAPGLKLDRIEPDGVVLSSKGYRFLAPK